MAVLNWVSRKQKDFSNYQKNFKRLFNANDRDVGLFLLTNVSKKFQMTSCQKTKLKEHTGTLFVIFENLARQKLFQEFVYFLKPDILANISLK